MPTISDFLLKAGASTVQSNVFVRLTNNVTGTSYVSTAVTDSNGTFTINSVPAGSYTVATGPSGTGPWTNTGDANYIVASAAGDDGIFKSLTVLPSGPFTSSAPAGGTDLRQVRIAGPAPWIDVTAPAVTVGGTTYILGADPTGAVNSTTAFQNAGLAAQAAGGALIFVPAGNYKLATGTGAGACGLIVFSTTTVMGVGYASRLFIDSAQAYNVSFLVSVGQGVTNLVSNVTVRDLFFDGNERNMTYSLGPVNAPIFGEGTGNYVAPVHCGIQACLVGVGDPRNGSQTLNLKVVNCDFYDIAREAIWLGTNRNTLGQIDHTDTLVEGCRFYQLAYNSTVESTAALSWIGNRSNGSKMTDPNHSGYAIQLNYLDLQDVTISGNTFNGAGGNASGVGVADSRQGGNTTVTDLVIANNTFRNFSGLQTITTGAIVTVKDANVTGNRVISCHCRYGIYALDRCNVVGNFVSLCDLIGISIGGSNTECIDNTSRSNNRLNSGTAIFRCGLVLGENLVPDVVDNCVVKGNRVYDDNGSQFQYAVGTTITPTNLTFEGNDLRGNVAVDGASFQASIVATLSNSVRANDGYNPDKLQNAGFAASWTPSLADGTSLIDGPLTAAQTINNMPGSLYLIPGQVVTFKIIHDATANAYAITWGSTYKRAGGAFANTNTANAVDTISFKCDGTNWHEIGRALNVA